MIDPLVQQELKSQLLELREDLMSLHAAEQEGSSTVELDQARVGRLSRMDALQGQAMSIETQRRRQLLLKDITSALERIDAGDYGLCRDCDADINVDRLRINPASPLCIDCASTAERN